MYALYVKSGTTLTAKLGYADHPQVRPVRLMNNLNKTSCIKTIKLIM